MNNTEPDEETSTAADLLSAGELATYGFASMTFGGDRITAKLTNGKCAMETFTIVGVDDAGIKVSIGVKRESHDPTSSVAIYGVDPRLNAFFDLPLSTPTGLAPKKIPMITVRRFWTLSIINARKPPNPLCT